MSVSKFFPDFPSIIGHRGLCAEAPENTLISFKKAAQRGLSWVECDVRLSKDHVPMVFHDDYLKRTTNSAGLFSLRTAKELQQLDAGSWFSKAFRKEAIPTLEQLLRLADQLSLGVNIEVKPNRGEDEITVEAVELLFTSLPFSPKVLFSSYSSDCIKRCQELLSEYPRALIVGQLSDQDKVIDSAISLGCHSLHIHHSLIDSQLVEIGSQHPLDMLCFTVNSSSLAEKCFAKNIISVFSDNGLQSTNA